MRALVLSGLIAGAAVLLSSCGEDPKPEEKLKKGQVVATVNGEDVTVYELGTELQSDASSGEARKTAEKAALQKIIDRKILADLARERKLDKMPEYLLQTRRADEQILVNLLLQDEAGKMPGFSSEDVEKFIADNPWMFSARKLLIIDQIQFPMPQDREVLKSYQPLKTLDEVEQKLATEGVEHRRVPTSLDTMQLPEQMVKNILALPPGEVFVVPAGGGLTANRIVEVRATPLTGREASNVAREVLRKQRAITKVTGELDPLIAKAREKVTYRPGYAPPPQAKAKASGATEAQ
jgi:peptidyl-prolyl cis-trans isomerase C